MDAEADSSRKAHQDSEDLFLRLGRVKVYETHELFGVERQSRSF